VRRVAVASGHVPDRGSPTLGPTVCLLRWEARRRDGTVAIESVAIAYVGGPEGLRARDAMARRLMARSDCRWWIAETAPLGELRDSPSRRQLEADLTRYRAVIAG
jgi:hypothetical protein